MSTCTHTHMYTYAHQEGSCIPHSTTITGVSTAVWTPRGDFPITEMATRTPQPIATVTVGGGEGTLAIATGIVAVGMAVQNPKREGAAAAGMVESPPLLAGWTAVGSGLGGGVATPASKVQKCVA